LINGFQLTSVYSWQLLFTTINTKELQNKPTISIKSMLKNTKRSKLRIMIMFGSGKVLVRVNPVNPTQL
jgi:hypothetical protein